MALALYGSGMHDWLVDELELGARVAHGLDSENNCGWSALMDLSYLEYCRTEQATNTLDGVCLRCGKVVGDDPLHECPTGEPVGF